MYVIADIESLQNKLNMHSPTQLAALRVDDDWNVVGEFFSYIRPLDSSFYDWNDVAYTGGRPEDFLHARGCYNVLDRFKKWVGEDTLCWWYQNSCELYRVLNRNVLKLEVEKDGAVLSKYVKAFLDREGTLTEAHINWRRQEILMCHTLSISQKMT